MTNGDVVPMHEQFAPLIAEFSHHLLLRTQYPEIGVGEEVEYAQTYAR